MRIFVTGGTGLIGGRLVPALRQRGDEVVLVTRRPDAVRARFAGCTLVQGDPCHPGPWADAIADSHAVVNLVGESVIAKRWNDEVKKHLRASRIGATRLIVEALAKTPNNPDGSPKVLVSGSAIGYYGAKGDGDVTESTPPGDDFLAKLAVDWEQTARRAESSGVRVALLRIGIVLDKRGGALEKLLTPFKMGMGGPAGSGKQWMSWIHWADLVGLFVLALTDARASGPLNGVAPQPVTNRDFATALGTVLGRPSFVPTPTFALQLALGEAVTLVTEGRKVLPARAAELGYGFKFPEVLGALRDAVGEEQ